MFSPDQRVSERVGPACKMCVQTEQETGPFFFSFDTTGIHPFVHETLVNMLVSGVCSVSNCHLQAGILILCRKTSVLDSKLILHGLVECDYML